MPVRGLRGATTCLENTKTSIKEATKELLETIFVRNSFEIEDICSIIFTVTDDLNAVFPGWVARAVMGLKSVAIQDVQHMRVPSDLSRCIRVLIHVNTEQAQRDIQHVYLNGAKQLRPDITGE